MADILVTTAMDSDKTEQPRHIMKTQEELNALKEEVEAVGKKLTGLSGIVSWENIL